MCERSASLYAGTIRVGTVNLIWEQAMRKQSIWERSVHVGTIHVWRSHVETIDQGGSVQELCMSAASNAEVRRGSEELP